MRTYNAFARVDTVDESLLKKTEGSGLPDDLLRPGERKSEDSGPGPQAGNPGKGPHAHGTFASRRGISPFGSFILGLPGETRETMEETISFAQGLGIPYGFHLLSPFPGTRVRERAAEFGLKILTDDWFFSTTPDHAVTETGGVLGRGGAGLLPNPSSGSWAPLSRR